MRVFLDVDTGTDDAGALWCAAAHPALELVGVSAGWGNTSAEQAIRNTLAVLAEVGATEVPVHAGAAGPIGDTPTKRGAEYVMGSDGLGDVGVVPPASAAIANEPGPEAIVRAARERPGEITLVALAPLSTVAAALQIEPDLPRLLAGLVVMGGACTVRGNVTPAAEANIVHDPSAAALVVDAFGRAGRTRPRLVPLDATLRAPLGRHELDAVARSPLTGAGTMHKVWSAIWPSGVIELGRESDEWPCHDLLALWSLLDRDSLAWDTGALAVDTGGSAAWGATVVDGRRRSDGPIWEVALGADAARFRSGVRAWLEGTEAS